MNSKKVSCLLLMSGVSFGHSALAAQVVDPGLAIIPQAPIVRQGIDYSSFPLLNARLAVNTIAAASSTTYFKDGVYAGTGTYSYPAGGTTVVVPFVDQITVAGNKITKAVWLQSTPSGNGLYTQAQMDTVLANLVTAQAFTPNTVTGATGTSNAVNTAVSTTLTQATATIPTCTSTQHLESYVCVENTKSCAIANGAGSQTWSGTTYGACTVTSCNSGYTNTNNTCTVSSPTCTSTQHLENNVCTSNTKVCTVTNGAGSQTWNGTAYGTCSVTSCNSGYTNTNGACAVVPPSNTGSTNTGTTNTGTITPPSTGTGCQAGAYKKRIEEIGNSWKKFQENYTSLKKYLKPIESDASREAAQNALKNEIKRANTEMKSILSRASESIATNSFSVSEFNAKIGAAFEKHVQNLSTFLIPEKVEKFKSLMLGLKGTFLIKESSVVCVPEKSHEDDEHDSDSEGSKAPVATPAPAVGTGITAAGSGSAYQQEQTTQPMQKGALSENTRKAVQEKLASKSPAYLTNLIAKIDTLLTKRLSDKTRAQLLEIRSIAQQVIDTGSVQ